RPIIIRTRATCPRSASPALLQPTTTSPRRVRRTTTSLRSSKPQARLANPAPGGRSRHDATTGARCAPVVQQAALKKECIVASKKFRIKESGTNSRDYPAGTICYDLMGHDYGLASDDTRITGMQHVSVTLDPTGDYPSFTVVASSLEELV